MQEGLTGTKTRETAASMILSMLETTAARAEKVVCLVSEKTTSVTRSEPPTSAGPGNCKEIAPAPSYPPLFDRIQELTESINRSLSGIEDVMRRCEL